MTAERFLALMQLIQTLRGPEGCPWDKKQTPRSIVLYLIEEIYELAEAIESGNFDTTASGRALGSSILFRTGIIVRR